MTACPQIYTRQTCSRDAAEHRLQQHRTVTRHSSPMHGHAGVMLLHRQSQLLEFPVMLLHALAAYACGIHTEAFADCLGLTLRPSFKRRTLAALMSFLQSLARLLLSDCITCASRLLSSTCAPKTKAVWGRKSSDMPDTEMQHNPELRSDTTCRLQIMTSQLLPT